ncbi:MAG: extracellular solute-binding protein [Ignavibacteriales bacterium]|nr:extracellular solute-binding protein [Ignavibacteriales bacterium]
MESFTREQLQRGAGILAIVLIIILSIILFVLDPMHIENGPGSQPTKVYFADHISPAHALVIEKFNRLHRGSIEVVPVNLPFDKFSTNERKELLARSLRSKSDRLDVFAVDYIWVPRFARWSEPLGQYFPKSFRAEIIPNALASCMSDTTMVSLPMYIDIGLMYYRQDIIRRLPDGDAVEKRLQASMTWEEMTTLRSRLGYQGKPFYLFQGNDYEGLVCNFFEFIAVRDRQFFSRKYVDLTSKMSPKIVTEFDENTAYDYMLKENVPFVRGWPNFLENYRKRKNADTIKLNAIGRAALPHIARGTPASVFGGWNLMISRYSANKTAALTFLSFLFQKETQIMMYEAGGYIPVNATVYADTAFIQRHPELAYYRQLLERGFHRPPFTDYTKISDIISHFVHRALRGELTVDAALRSASEMIGSNKVLIK